jgi:hypothetical protein
MQGEVGEDDAVLFLERELDVPGLLVFGECPKQTSTELSFKADPQAKVLGVSD